MKNLRGQTIWCAAALRLLRIAGGLSKPQLAEKLGVTISRYMHFEDGEYYSVPADLFMVLDEILQDIYENGPEKPKPPPEIPWHILLERYGSQHKIAYKLGLVDHNMVGLWIRKVYYPNAHWLEKIRRLLNGEYVGGKSESHRKKVARGRRKKYKSGNSRRSQGDKTLPAKSKRSPRK